MKMLRKIHPLAALLGLLLSLSAAVGEEPPAIPAAPAEAAEAGKDVKAPDAPEAKDDDDHRGEAGVIKVVGDDVVVHKGEKVRSVVVTQGSATIDGEVEEDAVVINGKLRINGRVHGDAVNVGGGLMLGTDARVDGNAVGVLGGIFMGTNSLVHGDAVGIGGITKRPGARVAGDSVPISIPSLSHLIGEDGLEMPEWMARSFRQLVLKGRPLSFYVGWSWMLAGVFALGYAVLLALFPKPVATTAQMLDERSVTSFLMGLLALPLLAFLSLILAVTGVGLIVVPFLLAAFVLAVLFGKAGLLCHLGGAVLRQLKGTPAPFAAFVVGVALISLFYLIPFVGLLAWAVLTMWGLGAALLALFGSFRKERAPAQRTPAASWTPPATPTPATSTSTGTAAAAAAATTSVLYAATTATPPANPPEVPPTAAQPGFAATPPFVPQAAYVPAPAPAPLGAPEAFSLPRVGLLRRIYAGALDWLLLLVVLHAVLWWLPERGPLRELLCLGYFIGFYVWKGSTLGGLVLGLKVVRLDGRKVDFACALVRALAAVFSGIAGGLGFFWCAWDKEQQTWHDKLAGTVVVRVEKMQPLV